MPGATVAIARESESNAFHVGILIKRQYICDPDGFEVAYWDIGTLNTIQTTKGKILKFFVRAHRQSNEAEFIGDFGVSYPAEFRLLN